MSPQYPSYFFPTLFFLNIPFSFDMTTIFVTYAGDPTTQFDRDYYMQHHLPLVQQAWGPYGMQSIAAFFPAGSGAGTIAVAICVFHDEAALQAALASPQTPAVMADVARFTDIKPVQSRAVPI